MATRVPPGVSNKVTRVLFTCIMSEFCKVQHRKNVTKYEFPECFNPSVKSISAEGILQLFMFVFSDVPGAGTNLHCDLTMEDQRLRAHDQTVNGANINVGKMEHNQYKLKHNFKILKQYNLKHSILYARLCTISLCMYKTL